MAFHADDVGNIIRQFIVQTFVYDVEVAARLTDETPLIDAGILDSFGVHETLFFLEERFAIEIRDEEVIPANLGSIRAMVELVRAKQASSDRAA